MSTHPNPPSQLNNFNYRTFTLCILHKLANSTLQLIINNNYIPSPACAHKHAWDNFHILIKDLSVVF